MTKFKRGMPTIHYTELEEMINENFPSKAGKFKYIDRIIENGDGVRNGTFISEIINGFYPEEEDYAINQSNLALYQEGREGEMQNWGENGTLGVLLGALQQRGLIDKDECEILVEVWW